MNRFSQLLLGIAALALFLVIRTNTRKEDSHL